METIVILILIAAGYLWLRAKWRRHVENAAYHRELDNLNRKYRRGGW